VDLHDPTHHAYSDVKRNLAQALIESENPTPAYLGEAAKLLNESLQRCEQVGDKQGVIGAHRVRAQLFAAQRKPRKRCLNTNAPWAGGRLSRRKREHRSAPRDTRTRAGGVSRLPGSRDGRRDQARAWSFARPASKAEEAALRKLEATREANFGATRNAALDAETSARVDALLSRMATKSLRIAALQKRDLSKAESNELTKLQGEMSDLHAELDRERTAAATKSATSAKASPIMAREWRQRAPGVVQLSYALGFDHAYVWARGDSGVMVSVLAVAPVDLERELIDLGAIDRQAEPQRVEEALAKVSSVLLPSGLLPANSSAVEIVAEGRIAGMPFPALLSPLDRTKRLVETHAITMITSMFAGEEPPHLKHARPYRLVALASGTGSLRSAAVIDPAPKLQAATKEVRTVAELFVAEDASAKVKLLFGADGSAAALRGLWGSGADVVHFATHALADLRQPMASLLVLPARDAGGAPTYLTAGQVEGWRGDIELVFLSACESAIGPPRFAGGMPGLQAPSCALAHAVSSPRCGRSKTCSRRNSPKTFIADSPTVSRRRSRSAETQRAWLAPKARPHEADQMRRRITALAHGFYTQ
jgi:hypothetical protein